MPERPAIDERRGAFEPALRHPHPGPGDQEVEQVWLGPGHRDVGCGYPDSRLADITLPWMAGRVQRNGPEFRDDAFARHAPRRYDGLRGTLRTTRVPVDRSPAGVRRTAS
ncbi:phospholipase effector Tle1 domain-containing protein [Geodermatophilus sp. URMC 61]|uniref:phospholipase effector Tle1 domain-containing protein n=1 Tax=Geodermatophilus sp. URMC 61 TaxID=3423411 RepID=UPI00406C726D